MFIMKIADTFLKIINSFNINVIINHNLIKPIYEKDDIKGLEEDWKAVGNDMKSVFFGEADKTNIEK